MDDTVARTRLYTLGRLAITVDGITSTAIAAQPVRAAFLVYVAVEREATRQTVAGLLWPDRDEARARHVLSQTVYQLRTDLGEGIIVTDREMLRVGPALWLDVPAFTEAVTSGNLAEAVALYGGPFLQGLRLANTNAFETWVDRERARLARIHRRARREHLDAFTSAGDTAAALRAARDWADLDPLEDEAQHRLIALLAESGQEADALRRFEDYARALAREDLTPLEETVELVERIRRGSSAGKTSGESNAPVPVMSGPQETPAPAPAEAPGEPVVPGSPEPARRNAGRRYVRIAAFAAAVLAVAALAYVLLAVRSRSGPSTLVAERVLVLPFANETGDASLDPVGDMAADWLVQGLAGTGRLQVVPTMDVLRRVDAPQDRATEPAGSGVALARELGAGLLVSGRYYLRNADIELYARLTDAGSGRVWFALEPVTASPSAVGAAIEEVGRRIMGSLAARFSPNVPLEAPSVIHPPTWEAWLAFDEGSRIFLAGDNEAAIPRLLEAARLDSSFVRPLLVAASAYGNLGDVAREDSLIEAVALRADRLAPYERAHVDWVRANLRGDLDAAYAAARRAVELAPGGPAHHVFARFTLALGRPRETLEVISALPRSAGWVPDWWNPWAYSTGAFHALGEHRRELEDARRALLEDRRLRMRVLEIRALIALGRLDEAGERLDSAALQPADPVLDYGEVLWVTVAELRAHGHRGRANTVLERAIRWYEQLPEPTSRQQWTRAEIYTFAGDVPAAAAIVADLRAVQPDRLDCAGLAGVLAAESGDGARAAAVADSLRHVQRPYLRGENTWWRAAIAARLGRTDEALRLLQQVWDEGRTLGFDLHAELLFEPLWNLPAYASLVVTER
jgi:DNA-binding SARP family transcriptional activator